jgi:uncharacterized protein YcaQ
MLWEDPGRRKTLAIIKQLSYLQIDAIFIAARSQDLVLHSRSTSYKEEDVWKLLKSKKVIEAFAHARSLVPLEHLPYYYSKMLRKRGEIPRWYERVARDTKWRNEILDLGKNGKEIGIQDINVPEDVPKQTQWSSAPKRMLDFLSTRGYLFPSKRVKFQSFYKIPELQFKDFDTLVSNLPSREEEFLFHIESTIKSTGPSPLHRLLHYKEIYQGRDIRGSKS